MMPNIQVERASQLDLSTFAQMEKQADTEQFIVPYSIDEHQNCFLDESSLYLRIVSSKKVVGFFILVLDKDDMSVEFRRIVIAPSERGIGQTAIPLMEEFCHQTLMRKRLWLDVYESNTRGLHVYTKLGYRIFNKGQGNGGPLLFLEKSLS